MLNEKLVDETLKDIHEIKNPSIRLNILLPVIGCIVLFAFCVRMFFMLIHSNSAELNDVKEKNIILEKKADALNAKLQNNNALWQQRLEASDKRYDDCQALRYDESQARINDFKALLRIADSVKTQLKTLNNK